jgi:hypothetical protein
VLTRRSAAFHRTVPFHAVLLISQFVTTVLIFLWLNEPSDPEILRFVNRWTAEMREVMIQQVNDLRIRRFDFNLADQKVGCACITRYP